MVLESLEVLLEISHSASGAWRHAQYGWKRVMKIIIVDDSPLVRERLISMCADLEGVQVVGEAENVLEAVRAIKRLHPDLVVLDIKMPLGSGIDVLRHIKKSDSSCKVIVLTNYPYPQYREKCKALGAEYFFDKSTEFEKVPEVLEQLLDHSATET